MCYVAPDRCSNSDAWRRLVLQQPNEDETPTLLFIIIILEKMVTFQGEAVALNSQLTADSSHV